MPHFAFHAALCSPVLTAGLVDLFQRSPSLEIALTALLVVPLVAGVSAMVRRSARAKAGAAALESAHRAAERAGAEPLTVTALNSAQHARLAVQGVDNCAVPLARPLIRIGRNKDNDICLSDRSVHRYHAVVERSSNAAFVITDLSGAQGNGIRINGERTTKAQLKNGDVIELGRATLKFETASA